MNRVPVIYRDGNIRTLLPICPQRQRFGMGIEVDGAVVRVAITPQNLKFLQACIADYISSLAGTQSPISELMASEPKSVPSDGV